MADIQDLIDMVEAGTVNSFLDFRPIPDNQLMKFASRAYRGSLDAAKALHDSVLPGWGWGRYFNGEFYVSELGPAVHSLDARAANPARAWLLCILKAMKEEADG